MLPPFSEWMYTAGMPGETLAAPFAYGSGADSRPTHRLSFPLETDLHQSRMGASSFALSLPMRKMALRVRPDCTIPHHPFSIHRLVRIGLVDFARASACRT